MSDAASSLTGGARQQSRSQPIISQQGSYAAVGTPPLSDFSIAVGGGSGDVAGVHAVMLASGGEYPVIDELPQVCSVGSINLRQAVASLTSEIEA